MPDPRSETLDREALERLREIEAGATPTPWSAEFDEEEQAWWIAWERPDTEQLHTVLDAGVPPVPGDARLIAEVRNALPALLAAEQRAEEAERVLRYELWVNHGHEGLYGDDGEMQCGRCPLDFKRAPLADVCAAATAGRLERAAKHAHLLAPHKAAEEEKGD